MEIPYRDRADAARALSASLSRYSKRDDVIVVGLPRGGVPVAADVALALKAPLDVLIVRKLGMPGQPELAVGAVASGGVRVLNPETSLFVSEQALDEVTRRELAEVARREALYRGGRPPLALRGRTVILVDDGLATGSSMRAAVAVVRKYEPAAIVVAVPVAPRETIELLRPLCDDIVCPATPSWFRAIGLWYLDFRQVGDDEVATLLGRSWRASAALSARAP